MRHNTPKIVVLLGASLLAGCLAGPSDSRPGSEADPSARSKTGTVTSDIPPCVRVWSEAKADSVWYCTDPKPPFPAGKGG